MNSNVRLCHPTRPIRLQPLIEIEQAIKHPQSADITDLNFDLTYGAAAADRCFDLKDLLVIGLAPDRIACFGYAHLPPCNGARSKSPQIHEGLRVST